MRNLAFFILVLLAIPVTALIPRPSEAQNAVPMLVNYQGEVRSPATGEPVPDGAYDMLFRIYDDATEGTPLWEQIHSILYDNPIQVRNGVFNVLVGSGTGSPLDRSIFSGPDRWLEVRVGIETLSPRQRIVSSAYSIICEDSRLFSGREASSFANAIHAHSGAEITSGTVSETWIDPLITRDSETDSAIAAHAAIADAHHTKTSSFAELSDVAADAQIPPSIARDSEVVPTVLAGDGAGSNLDADYLDGNDSSAFALAEHVHDSRYWDLTGNTGTDPATHFLGTADNQALEFRVNNVQVLRLEPGDSPNIIAGYGGNAVTAGAAGAAIAGGGSAGFNNRVTDDYGTIGGGRNNQAGDDAGTTADARYGTVGGGYSNTARAEYGTVGGGFVNAATGEHATIAGGDSNEASGPSTTIGGGSSNLASGRYATIAGGGPSDPNSPSTTRNVVTDEYGTIGGGGHNQAGDNAARRRMHHTPPSEAGLGTLPATTTRPSAGAIPTAPPMRLLPSQGATTTPPATSPRPSAAATPTAPHIRLPPWRGATTTPPAARTRPSEAERRTPPATTTRPSAGVKATKRGTTPARPATGRTRPSGAAIATSPATPTPPSPAG